MDDITKKQVAKILNAKRPRVRKITVGTGDTTKVGIVSDTHLCSSYEEIGKLNATYKFFKEHGVKTVLHAGDIAEGNGKMFRGQELEMHTFGADRQVDYVCDKYPKVDGIKTFFITGNHGLSHYNSGGIDIGTHIARKRKDMMYLGQWKQRIDVNGLWFDLVHPSGGGAYAYSYKAQKMAEQIPSGDKPQILIQGHYHTAIYFWYREIHIFNAGCFQNQTPYLARKGLYPCIGAWYLKIKHTGLKIHAITPNFIHL